jgi:hypothetical protein
MYVNDTLALPPEATSTTPPEARHRTIVLALEQPEDWEWSVPASYRHEVGVVN